MSDWDTSEDDVEEGNTISLDDLEELEKERSGNGDIGVDEDDWGDSFNDLDSEAWERQYGQDDDDLEPDPWDLD